MIKAKFDICELAISDCKGTEQIEIYSEHMLERSIVDGITEEGHKPLRVVAIKKIEAREVPEEILQKEVDNKVILKIDVEGFEYGIFENIHDTDILDRVDCIIIEYHRGIMPLLHEIDARHFRYRINGNEKTGFIFTSK